MLKPLILSSEDMIITSTTHTTLCTMPNCFSHQLTAALEIVRNKTAAQFTININKKVNNTIYWSIQKCEMQ